MSEPTPTEPAVVFFSPRFAELFRALTWLFVVPAIEPSVNRYGWAGLLLPPFALIFALLLRWFGYRIERKRWWRAADAATPVWRRPAWQLPLLVITLCALVFAFTHARGADTRPFGIVRYGALSLAGLASGQLDRLLAAWWLHLSRSHLFGNIGPLWLALEMCAKRYGALRAVAIVGTGSLATALIAALSLLLFPNVGYVVGASVLWCVATGAIVLSKDAPLLRFALLLNVLLSSIGTGVSASSHAAGLLCGIVAARLLRERSRAIAAPVILVHLFAIALALQRGWREPPTYELWAISSWASRATDVTALMDLAEVYALSSALSERALGEELARRVLAMDPRNARARALAGSP